jgi:antitoxin ParD1/3/4
MQIVLPPELEILIQHQLDSGKYQTALEVIQAGITRLEQEAADPYQGWLAELQHEARIGWKATQRGEITDGATAMAEIRANLRGGLTSLEQKEQRLLGKPQDEKLSWEDTYRAMATEDENWTDSDALLLDGLEITPSD